MAVVAYRVGIDGFEHDDSTMKVARYATEKVQAYLDKCNPSIKSRIRDGKIWSEPNIEGLL